MFHSRSRFSVRFLAALPALVLVVLTSCRRPPEEDAKRIRFAFWGSVQQQRAEEEPIDRFREAHPQEVTRIFYNHIERALADPDIPAEEILAGMEYDLERWLQRMQRRGIFESSAETPAGG